MRRPPCFDSRPHPRLYFGQHERHWRPSGCAGGQRHRAWKGRVILEAFVYRGPLQAGQRQHVGHTDKRGSWVENWRRAGALLQVIHVTGCTQGRADRGRVGLGRSGFALSHTTTSCAAVLVRWRLANQASTSARR